MKSLIRSSLAALTLAAGVLVQGPALAQEDNQALTPKQQDAVKKLVREYILENPAIIAEAIDALREREQLAAELEAKRALADRKDDIYNDARAPVLGNPEGDVTIVEFFDYRCTYCKSVSDTLFDTAKADGKVRIIMKELPVLGPDSVVAARAALAAQVQKKYEPFHRALMRVKGPLNEQAVMKAAADSGINVEKLKKDMDDGAIAKALSDNAQLARSLGVRGTPAFIIGDQLVPGAVGGPALKQLIDQARNPQKS